MTSDGNEKILLFLVERHQEVVAELNALKDSQLQINSQIEKLTRVLFGLAQQIGDLTRRMETQQKTELDDEDDWLLEWASFPSRKA